MGPVPPITGGIAHHSARLVEGLRDLGHEVDVLSWRAQYPRLMYRGQQVDGSVPSFPGARFDLNWWNPRSWLRARETVREMDMVVYPYATPFLAIPQRAMISRAKSRVAVVHNALPHERMPLSHALARVALSRADRLITHGEGVADDLRTLGLQTRIRIVPMPPTIRVEPSPLPSLSNLRLLFFGFVRPYKGLEVLLDAIAVLKEADFDASLTVAGQFWQSEADYREKLESLGITDRVTIRSGYLSEDELRAHLRSHHIVVAPYVQDTLSAVVPVALGAGRPVVTTTVRGVSAQVVQGKNAVLVTPRDPRSLAQGVVEAAAKLVALAEGAATFAPTWTAVAQEICDALE